MAPTTRAAAKKQASIGASEPEGPGNEIGSERENAEDGNTDDDQSTMSNDGNEQSVGDYFAKYEDKMTHAMKIVQREIPFGPYKELDDRDVDHCKTITNAEKGVKKAKDSERKKKVNRTLDDHKYQQARDARGYQDPSKPSPPIRHCCYRKDCAYSANDVRETIRHFTRRKPHLHARMTYEPSKVFGVSRRDWLNDVGLVCTLSATDTKTWYEAFERNGFGPNKFAQLENEDDDMETDDEDEDEKHEI